MRFAIDDSAIRVMPKYLSVSTVRDFLTTMRLAVISSIPDPASSGGTRFALAFIQALTSKTAISKPPRKGDKGLNRDPAIIVNAILAHSTAALNERPTKNSRALRNLTQVLSIPDATYAVRMRGNKLAITAPTYELAHGF